MTLDTKAQAMAVGEALLEAPIGELIFRIAASIAEAQLKLDEVGVRVATMLSETRVPFAKQDGSTIEKSLLELGFVPPFYAFTETEIEVKMTMNLKIEEDTSVSGQLDVGGQGSGLEAAKRVVPFGLSVSAEHHRKYEFDMSGSSMVRTKLVSIPAPSVFLETIQEHARAMSAMAANTDADGDAGG